MRITESSLRKIIREELQRTDEGFSDWASQAMADAGSATLSVALSPFLKVKTAAIDIMIPLFKASTTEAEAVAALRDAINGPYKGNAAALIKDTLDSIPSLDGIAGVARKFAKSSAIATKPITAALRYLKQIGQNETDVKRIAAAVTALIAKAGAKMYNPIDV